MKKGARLLAVASGPIYERRKKRTILVGVVGRLGEIEGVLSENVEIDGSDGTLKILRLMNKSRFKEQIKAIAINGVAIAGLNVVDVKTLERKSKVPVLILTRNKPNMKAFVNALKRYSEANPSALARIDKVKELNAERPFKKSRGFYVQGKVLDEYGNSLIETAFETLRIAHMIAKGVSTGVSKGRI
ncbi:MAG: DUF99 family protein [Candidatus Marsarchaeota archaeon]|jgi:hypothetical protein|nr:DUF99 family protein [Candidatus Marsarchaeota archaeon]